ncbi:hypothetical protein EBT16_00570 [bacterium]|nr:hypothetical protein [bacterium]
MNDFQEELVSLASKKAAGSKSQLERDIWERLGFCVRKAPRQGDGEKILCKYALWAAWVMNNRSPFHTGPIRKSARLRRTQEKRKILPKALHSRMIFTQNDHAKEYAEWISRKPNIFERPI